MGRSRNRSLGMRRARKSSFGRKQKLKGTWTQTNRFLVVPVLWGTIYSIPWSIQKDRRLVHSYDTSSEESTNEINARECNSSNVLSQAKPYSLQRSFQHRLVWFRQRWLNLDRTQTYTEIFKCFNSTLFSIWAIGKR